MEKRNLWRKLTTCLLSMLMAVFLLPAGVQFAFGAISGAPATEKNLYDNGDGTYTLSLSVTGQAESSSTTEVTKANVILVLDTSSSMNSNRTTYGGQSMTRLNAEKHVLCDDGGIIDSLLEQNVPGDPVKSDIIEVAVADFGRAGTIQQSFTTSGTDLKSTINGLNYTTGTNWEEGLMRAQELANTIKTSQPDEEVYVIFLTDGEPTTHNNDYSVNTNFAQEWAQANDNARAIVTAGHHFYGIFTWGSGNSSHYLSSLVQYAYTGEGNSNTQLDTAYAQYFTDATDTETLISALKQITHDITSSVGYTNVELEDGVTSMTTSNIKTTVDGDVTGFTYYKGNASDVDPESGEYGDVWSDAPHATVTDGVVDWDLDDIVLENGVTYTVTFVVWPSQESLDLVADLNNGVKDYNSLTEEQKSQISVSGGHYKLKTNTDYPTVTYSTVTTTTVDGVPTTVVSDPQTATITNPDPVQLAEEKLNALKIWEDSMDPKQREEFGGSVKLYLKVDGEDYYVDEDGNPLGVTLQEPNWEKSDYIAVAPGLLVTEDSPAYDATKPQYTYDGVTYAMIEPGHDYVFEEDASNIHFELTSYHHHPMIMGENSDKTLNVVDVIFNEDQTEILEVRKLTDSLSATNSLKGGINITKKVVGEDGKTEIDDINPFTVKVKVTDSEGNALPEKKTDDGTEYTIDYRIYYGENNPAYATSGEQHRSDHIYVTGTEFTETLYVGDTIRVVNVEDGALYEVTETAPAGYEYVTTNYQIDTGDGAADFPQGEDPYVQNNSASYAEVVNKLTYGSLEVSKTVEVTSGDEEQAKDKEFEFTFKLYSDNTKAKELTGLKFNYTITKADGTETKGTISSSGTFKLKDGDKIAIDKLPEGTFYEVTEAAKAGFVTTKTGDTGTVVKNETAEAEFTNTYTAAPVSVDPPVQKVIENDPDPSLYNQGDFTFTIANTAAPQGVTAPMPENTSITNSPDYELEGEENKGWYEFGEITFTAPGTYTYTITESGSVLGVTNDAEATKTVTFTVTDNGKGQLVVTPTTDNAKFTFTNVYKTGELDITKTVVDGDEDKEFTFTVTLTDADGEELTGTFPYTIGETEGTIASGGTLKLKHGETAKITGIPEGASYTVEEETEDGYTTTKTGDTGTIDSTTPSEAEFTNTYDASGTAKLEATKAIEGAAWPEGPDGSKKITFTLTGEEGAPMPPTGSETQTLDTAGSVPFGEIEYGLDDVGQTYTYTITEDGFGTGWTGTPTEITATVEVTDNGNGTLGTNITYSPEDATFTNKYVAEGEAVLEVTKAIAGAAWPEGETLTLTLAGEGGTLPEKKTVTLTAPGKATFDAITYTEADIDKEYTYTISEDGFGTGWSSSGDVTATVKVTDNGDGTLATEVTYSPESDIITNTYTASGSIVLEAKKDLEGRDWMDGESFTFELKGEDGKTIESKSVTSNTTVAFSAIEYTQDDAGKTFTYTITETGTLPANVTKSGDITATVKVVDNHDGTLGTSVKYSPESDTIINTYVPDPVNATIKVNKSIEGYLADESGNADATFIFELYDESGEQIDETSITTQDGSGTASFKDIPYEETGVYTYTVKEKIETKPGFTYDLSEYKVTVTVTDNPEEGNLEAEIAYEKEETSVTDIEFINKFKMKGTEVELELTKNIDDQSDSAHDTTFEFKLYKDSVSDDNLIATESITTKDLTGSVTFKGLDALKFDKADEYKFVVVETDTGESGFTYDTTEHTYIVKIDNNFDAAILEVNKAESTLEAEVTNIYKAKEVSTILTAEKEVNDTSGSAYETEFTFTLKDKDGETLDTQSRLGPGSVEFAPIEYEKAGTYTYTIQETAGSAAGYIYDTAEYKVKVIVEDVNGELQATAIYAVDESGEGKDSLTITNTYDPKDAEVFLKATKVVEDKTGGATGKTFTFELRDSSGKVVETVSRVGGGPIEFSQLVFSKVGEYSYTIQEVAGSDPGYTYDTEPRDVTITVTDPDKDGILKATVSPDPAEEEIVITNPYEAKPVSLNIEALKVLEGRKLKKGEFTFQLIEDGEIIDETTNKADGSIVFSEITYEKSGSHYYTIVEVEGEEENMIYDDGAYTVTVRVIDDGEGQLTVDVSGVPVFTNTLEETPPDEPDTGDNNDLAGMIGLMGTSALGLLYMVFRRRRGNDR